LSATSPSSLPAVRLSLPSASSLRNLCARRLPRPCRGVSALYSSSPFASLATRHSHACDKKQPLLSSPKSRLYRSPQTRDASKSFRTSYYENCRVSPALSLISFFFKFFRCNTYGSPRKCCKQKTYGMAKLFRCNTYKKHGEGVQSLLTSTAKHTWPGRPLAPSRAEGLGAEGLFVR
jgi:hypothetical protein